ncbi:PAS domain S-box protein [Collimonas sp.]|jgi:PAS domain S-box-containing protein|uniref:PAS domain-containing sensor histidine kinase n=1 Tax=Collimonas sp. TaxID=1963772 RepID=UPI002B9ADA69|nr:PAS domain S-box protein [Collimonas sp.]HWW07722.1 PAS domain S-box protein [Collimonas sp.]
MFSNACGPRNVSVARSPTYSQNESRGNTIEAADENSEPMTSMRDDPAANSLLIGKDFFQEVFAQSTVAMSAVSPDKIFLAINPAACMLLGYAATELQGKHFADILHPADQPAMLAALDRLAQDVVQGALNGSHLNCRCIHKSGQIIHARTHISPLRNEHGAPAYFFSQIFDAAELTQQEEIDTAKLHGSVGFARDISRRKQTEKHLALVDFALNQVNDSLFLIDKDARFRYVNDAACRALNYSRAELLEMGIPDIDPDWPAARWPQDFNDLKILAARKFETRHKTKDGRIFPVEVNSKYFEYLGCSYKVSLARDITESKQVEELLSKREQEFRTLAENLPDLVVRYDRNCRRTYVNPAYERATGIPARHAMNEMPDAKWRTGISGEEYNATLKKVMATRIPAQIFIRATKMDQQLTDYVFHIVAECNLDGEVNGALAIGKNITVLKETQRRLEESQLLLRQLAARNETAREDERRHLSREIHDELGQCLSALRMNMSVLGLQCKEDDASLQATIRRMITLVDSTIQVVRNLVTSLRPSALDMGIVPALEWLVEEFSNGHPDIHCSWYVAEEDIHLDEKRATEIFRIAQESLTNISRHADATKVRIALERKEGRYLLEVRDNGRGFDPSQRKKQSFGLLGVRERVLMLGGEIAISSVPNQETIIKVGIPVHNVLKN